MNWPRFAVVTLLVLSFVGLVLPWVTGIDMDQWPDALRWGFVGAILVAMFVLGKDERRREKEADTWVDNPRTSKLQNWLAKRRTKFSPKRGAGFFFLGIFAFSFLVVIEMMTGTVASFGGAVAFVLGMSILAGLIGMFTEKVPL